jgi:hypothetical protein
MVDGQPQDLDAVLAEEVGDFELLLLLTHDSGR